MRHELELPPAPERDLDSGSVFFVGTATVLLRYAGFTILTDPNFLHRGDHVHLGYGLTSERLTEPAMALEDLPPDLDLVLLSHYHGDHFDRVVEANLDRDVPILTTEHAAEELVAAGFTETYPMEAWERTRVRKDDVHLDVTATPARHGPPVVEKALPPVMGSVLAFRPASTTDSRAVAGADDADEADDADATFRLYVSGDTVLYDDLREIPRRFPEIDLALLHLGGTKILGVLLTMDAEQGVQAVELIDAETSIPIHYDDYEVFRSPLSAFRDAVREAGLEDRVAYLERGETYEFEVAAPVVE